MPLIVVRSPRTNFPILCEEITDMAYRSLRYTPRLECLNERALPSVTITENDGTLLIVGDQQENNIEITDNGTGDVGAVKVAVEGVESYVSTELVTNIRVLTRAGADSVDYSLTGDLVSDRTVYVFTGNQHDSFDANLNGWDIDGADLSITANGGNGHDSLSFHGNGTDVGAGASLSVKLLGGNGMDTLLVDFTGVLIGDATLKAYGGNGKDSITGNVALPAPEASVTEASTGTLTARFCGGNGVDDMTVSVLGVDDLSGFDVLVHGGHGKDNFVTTGVTAADAPKAKA